MNLEANKAQRKTDLEFVLGTVKRYLKINSNESFIKMRWSDLNLNDICSSCYELPEEIRNALAIIKNQASREEIISESQMSTSQMSSILPYNSPETLDGYKEAVTVVRKWHEIRLWEESGTSGSDSETDSCDSEFSEVGQICFHFLKTFSFLEVFD